MFRQATAVDADGQYREQQQHSRRQGAQQDLRKPQGGGSVGQVAECRQRGKRWQGAAEREAGEQRHACDFSGPQAMTRIQAVANRAAGQHRKANGIADGKSGETAQCQGSRGQAHAGVAAGGPFVTQQDDETDDGSAQRAQQCRLRNLEDRVVQRVQVELAQQVTTGNQRDGEQQQGDRQADGLAVLADSIKQA
ncbi:hypothetical protein D3C73_1103970 [compost metagenome]